MPIKAHFFKESPSVYQLKLFIFGMNKIYIALVNLFTHHLTDPRSNLLFDQVFNQCRSKMRSIYRTIMKRVKETLCLDAWK